MSGICIGLFPVLCGIVSPDPASIAFALLVLFIASILVFLISYGQWDNVLSEWAVFFMGTFYIGFALFHALLLRDLPLGRDWILFLLVVVFAGDTGAFYVGTGMGRHKLCPHVSKGKTVEGAVGGLFFSTAAGILLALFLMPFLDPRYAGFAGALTGIAGQVGDLAESMVKRSAGVKDSGRLLPGHGGILDRIDGVLMAGPVLYWILYFSNPGGVAVR